MAAVPSIGTGKNGVHASARSLSKKSVPEPKAGLTEAPPVGLTKEAREAWILAIRCAPDGVLAATDLTVLERWARNYALYRKTAKQLDHEGLISATEKGAVLNPLFNALIKIQQVLSVCEKELGFTPASRARVSGAVGGGDDETNDFESF